MKEICKKTNLGIASVGRFCRGLPKRKWNKVNSLKMKAISLYVAGSTSPKIARKLKVAQSTVSLWCKEVTRTPSEQKSGQRSGTWRGGITSLQMSLRNNKKTYVWRKAVFERDNYTCVWCGVHNEKGLGKTIILNADHIKSFALIIENHKISSLGQGLKCAELWDVENGRTLCKPCHQLTPSFGWGTKRLLLKTMYN